MARTRQVYVPDLQPGDRFRLRLKGTWTDTTTLVSSEHCPDSKVILHTSEPDHPVNGRKLFASHLATVLP